MRKKLNVYHLFATISHVANMMVSAGKIVGYYVDTFLGEMVEINTWSNVKDQFF